MHSTFLQFINYDFNSVIMKLIKFVTICCIVLVGPLLSEAEKPPENDHIDVLPALVALFNDIKIASVPHHDNAAPPAPIIPNCECAVFNTVAPTTADQAIISQNITGIRCITIEKQQDHCRKLCSDLARATKERGSQLLCNALGHYYNLKASVHSRMHGTVGWTYTGLTFPTDICCHEHKIIDCKVQTKNLVINHL